MDKYLIINADDFGMCHSANVAVSDLFTNGGCITSATIMAPCAWAKEAVDSNTNRNSKYNLFIFIGFYRLNSIWKMLYSPFFVPR